MGDPPGASCIDPRVLLAQFRGLCVVVGRLWFYAWITYICVERSRILCFADAAAALMRTRPEVMAFRQREQRKPSKFQIPTATPRNATMQSQVTRESIPRLPPYVRLQT